MDGTLLRGLKTLVGLYRAYCWVDLQIDTISTATLNRSEKKLVSLSVEFLVKIYDFG
jgi:hypothetical protein